MSTIEYTFFNYPKQYTLKDYQDAIKKIVELHKNIAGIHALYRFGSLSAPGISDIDYFIVTDGNPYFRYTCPHNKLSEKEKYFFQHYPSAIVPKQLLPTLHLLAPFFELECIYGNKKDNVKCIISDNLAIIFLSDILCMFYPKKIEKKDMTRINVRKTLMNLYAVKYPIKLFNQLGITKKKWHVFIKKVEILRRQWFNKANKEQEILILFNEMSEIILEMIQEYSVFYKKIYFPTEDMLFRSRTLNIFFKKEHLLHKSSNKNTILISSSIGHQFQEYAETKTCFGNYIKKHLEYYNTSQKTSPLFDLRNNRCEAISQLLNYACAIHYRRGAFSPFDIRYMDHQGVANQIRDFWWQLNIILSCSQQ